MENIDKLYEELEKYENVKYRMGNEGFYYCFRHYSKWKEIEDETFHQMRQEFLDISEKISNYIDDKIREIKDNIDEEQ